MSQNNIFVINTIDFSQNRNITIGYEPIRQNRFIVDFPTYFNIPNFAVQKITRPNLSFVNNQYIWGNIEMELIDLISPSTSKGVMNMINYCKNLDNKENQNLFSFFISDLDPTGITVENWIIDVKELVSVNFGESNYGMDEVLKIKITLKPNRCRIQ